MTAKKPTYRQISPNEYEEVKDYEQLKEDILTAETFPKRKIGRLLILLGIAHVSLLVILFTLIITVRYAIQL